MPTGFPWGMPPNFMPEGPVPTFASLPASSPVLAVPPPVVHTTPRVDDTIYHSEPSEGPDVNEKMEAMNDQFLELRKELILHIIHLLINVWALRWLRMVDGIFNPW